MQELVEASNVLYESLLGYKPEKTSLRSVKIELADCPIQDYRVRLSRSRIAFIEQENPLSLFHEYFGHGLYCEQSVLGRRMVKLKKNFLKDERYEFDNRDDFRELDLSRFRRQNNHYKELEELGYGDLSGLGNSPPSELFAIWTEYFLSEKFGLGERFERKYGSLDREDKEEIESVVNFSKKYGDLATFYSLGLARRTTSERAKKLLEGVYGTQAVDNSRLILLSGSKQVFSDINLIASSNVLQPMKNEWLDSVAFNEDDFERRVKLFEPIVTHPIIRGEFVAGDKNYLARMQTQIFNQPITEEAIKYNFTRAEQERKMAEETKDEKLRETIEGYAQIYLANALALQAGKRRFTRKKLREYFAS